METRSKKRLRLQNASDTSEPNANHNDNVSNLTRKTSKRRQHAAEEAEGRSGKLLIPNETLLVILRWLQCDDLDAVQITTRRLRSLVENNEIPLEPLDVSYYGDDGAYGWSNCIRFSGKTFPLDDEVAMDKARRYLKCIFFERFIVSGHSDALPNLQLLTAGEVRAGHLYLGSCNFNVGEDNALEKTLSGCHFNELVLNECELPVWQLNDDRLRDLCRVGCHLVDFAGTAPLSDDEKYAVTDEGILDYCFSSDLGALKDRGRYLAVTEASTTPALLKKCIQASKESKVTGRVRLVMHHLEDEYIIGEHMVEFGNNLIRNRKNIVEYDFPDQGNGMRLKIEFVRHWSGTRMELRHASKDVEFHADWRDMY